MFVLQYNKADIDRPLPKVFSTHWQAVDYAKKFLSSEGDTEMFVCTSTDGTITSVTASHNPGVFEIRAAGQLDPEFVLLPL